MVRAFLVDSQQKIQLSIDLNFFGSAFWLTVTVTAWDSTIYTFGDKILLRILDFILGINSMK